MAKDARTGGRSGGGVSQFGDDDITPLPAPIPLAADSRPSAPSPPRPAPPPPPVTPQPGVPGPFAAPLTPRSGSRAPQALLASAAAAGASSDRPLLPAVFVVELPPTGDLAQLDAPRIVAWAVATNYSGCLWLGPQLAVANPNPASSPSATPPEFAPIERGASAGALGPSTPDIAPHRELYFENGALIGAFSTLPDDGLVDYLAPIWSRPQLQRARYVLSDVPLHRLHQQLNRLCEAQLLPRAAATGHLVSYVRELCSRAVAIGPGRYRVLARAITRDERLDPPLPVRRLIVEGLRKSAELPFLQRRLGSMNARLRPTAVIGATEGGAALNDIGLSSAEESALTLFDGQHTLGDIMRKAVLGEHAVYVLAYSLVCLGTLAVAGSAAGARALAASLGLGLGLTAGSNPKSSPMPKSAPGPKSSPSIQLNEAELCVRRIQQLYRLVEEGDYFALLELSQGATTAEILRAHQALRADFNPAILPYRARTSMDRELRLIARALDEARIVLTNEESRRSYAHSLTPS